MTSPEVYNQRGIEYAKQGEYDKAIAEFDQAIRLKPDFAEAYTNRGSAKRLKGDCDGAIKDHNEAIRLKPDDAEAYNNRGNVKQLKGDFDGAIKDFDQAIRLKPDLAEAYNNRGLANRDKGDFDGAIKNFDEAIHLKPDDATAYSNRGLAKQDKGDFDGAIKDYDQAIHLKPDFVEAYYNRGLAKQYKGDFDGTIKDCDQAIRLKHDFAVAYINRGVAKAQKRDLDGAIKDFDQAIRLKPDDAAAYHNRGNAKQLNDDFDGAIEDFDEAIRLKLDSAEAYHNRGAAYYQKGEYQEAIANFDYAISLDPNLALSHKFRKLAYEEWNKIPEHLQKQAEESEEDIYQSLNENKAEKPKTQKAEKPKGLEEYSETLWHERQVMVQAIGQVMEQRGFMPLETSIFEYGKTLLGYISPKEVFSLEQDINIALRYDLTAPLARYVAENFEQLPKPFRRYQIGEVFRNDKPDKGRFRQFTQMDADSVGTDNIAADAEMIMMLSDCLQAAGLKLGEYQIKVNHRALLNSVFDGLGTLSISRASLMRTLDKYDHLGADAVSALLGKGRRDRSGDFTKGAELEQEQINQLLEFLQLSDKGSRTKTCDKIENSFGENKGTKALRTMHKIFAALGYQESQICFDTSIVRGLDYYTGCVFEAVATTDNARAIGSLGGGGRYDGLLKRFRSEPVPAVGMSIGISRLHSLLQQQDKRSTKTQALIIVLVLDQDQMPYYQKIAADLRHAGLRAETYIGSSNSMKAQLKYADRRQAKLAIIRGEDERAKNQIIIKDLEIGAQLAHNIKDNLLWRAAQHAQISIPENQLIQECLKLVKPTK